MFIYMQYDIILPAFATCVATLDIECHRLRSTSSSYMYMYMYMYMYVEQFALYLW